MKITAEKDEQSQYIVTIEVDAAELDEAKGKAARKLSNRYAIPGFRPGKAPRALVERFVGAEQLLQQATQDLLPKAYQNAIKQEDIKPIADPEFDIKSTDPLTIVATIAVEPTVELGSYQDIKFDMPTVEVTEDEITKVLEQLADQQSTWEEPETERPAQEGDQVDLSMQTIRDGEVIGSGFERTGVLGKGELLHPIDDQVTGMAVGEEKIVTVQRKPTTEIVEPGESENVEESTEEATETPSEEGVEAPTQEVETIELPDEEASTLVEEDIAPLTFKVVLNSIKVKHTPDMDDELAKAVSDVETLDALKVRVKENLVAQKDSNNKRELTEKIIKEAVTLSHIVMPPVMINAEIHALEDGMNQRLKQQKLTIDQYLRFMNKSHEEFHEELRPQAEDRIKTALVLREIARAEGITVEDGELDREVEKMVDQYTLNLPEDQREQQEASMRTYFRQEQNRSQMREDIFSRKLGERLIELATGSKPLEFTPLETPDQTDDQKAELSLEVDGPSVTGEVAPVENENEDEEVTVKAAPAKKPRAPKKAKAEPVATAETVEE